MLLFWILEAHCGHELFFGEQHEESNTVMRYQPHQPVHDVQLRGLDVAHAANDEVERRRWHALLERDGRGITPRALLTLHTPCIALHKEQRREFEQMLLPRKAIDAGNPGTVDPRAQVRDRVDNTAEDLQDTACACEVVIR